MLKRKNGKRKIQPPDIYDKTGPNPKNLKTFPANQQLKKYTFLYKKKHCKNSEAEIDKIKRAG